MYNQALFEIQANFTLTNTNYPCLSVFDYKFIWTLIKNFKIKKNIKIGINEQQTGESGNAIH